MRRLIAQEFITIDGFAAGPNYELDFVIGSTGVDATAGEAAISSALSRTSKRSCSVP